MRLSRGLLESVPRYLCNAVYYARQRLRTVKSHPSANLAQMQRMVDRPITTMMQILRPLSVVCLLMLGGCVSVWHVDVSNQGNLDIFHLRHSHGVFFPFMIGEDDLYLYVPVYSQQEGNRFLIPSLSGKASLCRYAHPIKRCTDQVEGEVGVLRVSDHWIELSISLSANQEHSMTPWSMHRGWAFRR